MFPDASSRASPWRVRLEWAVIPRGREYSTQPARHTYARIQLGWD
jgi:hypothetical protein